MIKMIKRIAFLAVALVLSLAGYLAYYTYENKNTTIAELDTTVAVEGQDQDVRVELYSRVWHEKENNPVFVVGELVNKCINYKIANPEDDDVTIDFAIYRMEAETACYYIPGTRNYGKVTKLAVDYTEDCERISYSFIKAAKHGIEVKLLYHRDAVISSRKLYDHFQKYMDEACFFDETKKVSDFLEVRKAEWPLDNMGSNQMHNKQLLISDYLDWDGKVYEDAVFTATSNVDAYNENTNLPISSKDWTHTGFTISNHEKIYLANVKYFDITFENYKNRFEFVDVVMAEHAKGDFDQGGLNYKDDKFECYFTPMPQTYTDLYDLENNPYAYYFERLKNAEGQIKCHMNMYHPGTSSMMKRLAETLVEAFSNNTTPGNEFGLKQALGLTADHEIYKMLLTIADEIGLEKMTHAKDTMMYFEETDEYITITGSTNLHMGEFAAKSNTMIVFKESGNNHEIYDHYLKAYHETTRNKGYGIGSNI